MDKNKLFAVLAYKLESSGVSKDRAVHEARSFVSALSDEEAGKLTALVGNDAVMTQIAASLKKRAEAGASSVVAVKPQPKPQPVRPQPQGNREAPAAVRNHTVQGNNTTPVNVRPQNAPLRGERVHMSEKDDDISDILLPKKRAAQPSERDGAVHPQRPVTKDQREAPRPQNIGAGSGARPQNRRPAAEQQQRAVRPSGNHAVNRAAIEKQRQNEKRRFIDDKKIISRPDPNGDYKKFYIILACTSPLWILLALAVLALFLFVLGAMCISIGVLIVGLIGGVAAGTVLSLVGVIYGITQLFSYAPIGYYEIGLGLMIGGIVMLGGIIVYNVAVRLLPYLIKLVFSLLIFTANKCVELYYHVKGACEGL